MIFFCGDTHGNFDHVLRVVEMFSPTAVVLLGDLQPQVPLHQVLEPILHRTDVWYIHGNHDTDSDEDYDRLWGSELQHRNLHGRVQEIAGLRVAGLGGIFRGQIWSPPQAWAYHNEREFAAKCFKGNRWRGGMPRKHHSTIFPETYQKLAELRADILVTHEAPSVHRYGFDALDALGKSLQVSKSFHGHHHDCLDYRKHDERLGFAAYGVGFCGIMDETGKTIWAGKYDHLRLRGGV